MKSRTYSLYLLKDTVKDFKDALSAIGKSKLQEPKNITLVDGSIGDGGEAYIFSNSGMAPSWLSDLSTSFRSVPSIRNESNGAVVVFTVEGRFFAVTFGFGWQYLDDGIVEADFGLMVAVNTLGDNKVKRIDKSHLGEAIKGSAHSAFHRDFVAFGIEEALDLVRRVSGKSEDEDFASSLSGATSLKITREMVFSDLPQVASEALKKSQSVDYRKTAFSILDKVRPVLDPVVRSSLDDAAVSSIKSGGDDFELSLPLWSSDDVVYYWFNGIGGAGRFPDLTMEEYRQTLGTKLSSLSVNDIVTNHSISAEFDGATGVRQKWSIKKSLVGSIDFKGGLYAANEGSWYRLDTQFKRDVDAVFSGVVEPWTSPPLKIIKKVKSKAKIGFESELDYNKRVAIHLGLICMDQLDIQLKSMQYAKFEACDLLDIPGRRFIHVKKSSRQSSVLSHFFKQGSNSARIFKLSPEARQELLSQVEIVGGYANRTALEPLLGDMSGWKVEFHIIDAPRKDGSFRIPFFSRISFRDENMALRSMGYHTGIKFIPV